MAWSHNNDKGGFSSDHPDACPADVPSVLDTNPIGRPGRVGWCGRCGKYGRIKKDGYPYRHLRVQTRYATGPTTYADIRTTR